MTKISKITLLLLLSISAFNTYAQDCKNMVENAKDEFTGEIKKTSMSLLEKGKGHESHLKIRQVKDSITITFIDFYFGAAILNSKMYQSQKGDLMYIKFSDETVIKLTQLLPAYIRNEQAGMGEKMVSFGYSAFSKSNKMLFEPIYTISKNDLKMLSEKTIKKIRVTTKGEEIQTKKLFENIEIEMLDENAIQVQKDIQCFVK